MIAKRAIVNSPNKLFQDEKSALEEVLEHYQKTVLNEKAIDVYAMPHRPRQPCLASHPNGDLTVVCDREKGHGMNHRAGTDTHVTHEWSDNGNEK